MMTESSSLSKLLFFSSDSSSSSIFATFHKQYLPPPFSQWASVILLENVEYADQYLITAIIVLFTIIVVQLKAFARPPPVPNKQLPKRPALSIQFRPDDPVTANLYNLHKNKAATVNTTSTSRGRFPTTGGSSTAIPMSSITSSSKGKSPNYKSLPKKASFVERIDLMSKRLLFGNSTGPASPHDGDADDPLSRSRMDDDVDMPDVGNNIVVETVQDNDDDDIMDEEEAAQMLWVRGGATAQDSDDDGISGLGITDSGSSGGERPAKSTTTTKTTTTAAETPFVLSVQDLPDSFAPLLSSSYMELSSQQLTADLIHAVQIEAGVRLRKGRHEIPLDKDSSRPQFVLDVPDTGCRMSAVVVVGSDRFNHEQDMDVSVLTKLRSKPMVKHAGLVMDPPLPLVNVAPTLIHFPTLFEDRNILPTLRSIQLVRFFVDLIVSISSFLEKCLWIIESQLQIHLSKVRITPIYKGRNKQQQQAKTDSRKAVSPEWRLQLAFSGHLLLFGWVPIPFISVTLPTFIIPQPHALLDYLISSQPLASARIRRENIAEQRIALAITNTAEAWNVDLKIVATPPAVGVDVTLPGGLSVAMEAGLWRDHQAGRNRETNEPDPKSKNATYTGANTAPFDEGASVNSMSSWTTRNEAMSRRASYVSRNVPQFDANELVPWLLELSAKGTISHEKMSVHVMKLSAKHESSVFNPGSSVMPNQTSRFLTKGSFAVWKIRPERKPSLDSAKNSSGTPGLRRRGRSMGRTSSGGHPELEIEDSPSVAAILMFPDETNSFNTDLRMLQYDYVFDVFEDSKIDAITLSVGATHPMLNGGTMVTTIFDSIYAFGSLTAREDSVLDPIERRRKRNILRHLPATDFTFGIQNIFIPPESESYSDDGQSISFPELEGGRMMLRFIGGMDASDAMSVGSHGSAIQPVSDGIKLVADFEIASLIMNVDSIVKEFPELDIHDDVKLHTLLSGGIGGSVKAHLRPQKLSAPLSTAGPNVFNPLEAYEIDFSKSSLSLKMKEFSNTLGHRRIMFPAESTFQIKVIESVVDMGFEGTTRCDLSWDLQGLSPILQATAPGQSPADASPDNREQVSLLVSPLRQGIFSLMVSSVGGISITKAATSREDKEGLYDWKFFNALVSPDDESMGRIMDVIHDKRTMDKLLQIVKIVNEDLHKFLRYTLEQVWRAKEIFDQEGVSDPGHAIPMYKMSRLVSLFLTGDVSQVDTVLPIVKRVVDGEGLDTVTVKDLLRRHLEHYDTWAPEIDRAVRWAALMFGGMSATQPYVEDHVSPLCELPHNAVLFDGIPSASQLYETLLDKPQLPLDPSFSNLISRVAPYLSFQQVEYILEVRPSTDWQPSDLRRIRYVYSIKRKVLEIAESYGGLSFLPQSFFLSVFLGEATRTSHRASTGINPVHQLGAARSSSRFGRAVSARNKINRKSGSIRRSNLSTLNRLRKRHADSSELSFDNVVEGSEVVEQTPAGRVASFHTVGNKPKTGIPGSLVLQQPTFSAQSAAESRYELGDCLLGPQDVAILLQAGLTSALKSSTVVQLNQRMLLDLICSQPRSFAIAVLAEIGTAPRSLTSALMALLELDQTAFKPSHQLDVHVLLESWLPELKIPRRQDYMAGGRWARQSYYDALFAVANSISEDAEPYLALRSHLQRVRHSKEEDPLPQPREQVNEVGNGLDLDLSEMTPDVGSTRLRRLVEEANSLIMQADEAGTAFLDSLFRNEKAAKESQDYAKITGLYEKAFGSCARVLEIDRHAFHAPWFRNFYRRNYDALMIKSMFDNALQDVDKVRHWLTALLKGAKIAARDSKRNASSDKDGQDLPKKRVDVPVDIFQNPEQAKEQDLIDAILDATIYNTADRERLRTDPLVRLLISNPAGHYDFVIILAAGVVTEGKQGLELKDAFDRLEILRGVSVIRADTATARSIEYNAGKVIEAIEQAAQLKKPYGLLGYSQGCANALMAESLLLSGSPKQQRFLSKSEGGLVSRQLLFSAANGSFHGPAMEKKITRLIAMGEDFFKSQAGYFSNAFSSSVLEMLNSVLDSAHFHKIMGGAQSFLPDGCRAFWREAQHLSDVPTCALRGVMERHTTPESLEMLSNLLTKQSGSALHDSQVHVFDAVGYPVYHLNRNGRVLQKCAVGESAIQRTHHWSPLHYEVEFVQTAKDIEMASFDCAKDRHIFPWVEVNKRFGFIKAKSPDSPHAWKADPHPSKLIAETPKKPQSN